MATIPARPAGARGAEGDGRHFDYQTRSLDIIEIPSIRRLSLMYFYMHVMTTCPTQSTSLDLLVHSDLDIQATLQAPIHQELRPYPAFLELNDG